jgi:hypothetical protein
MDFVRFKPNIRDPARFDVPVATVVRDVGITIRIASVRTVKPVVGKEYIVVDPIVLMVPHQSVEKPLESVPVVVPNAASINTSPVEATL